MYNFQLTLATKKRAIVDCLIMAVEHGPFHFGNKCTRQAMVGGHGKFLASTSFFSDPSIGVHIKEAVKWVLLVMKQCKRNRLLSSMAIYTIPSISNLNDGEIIECYSQIIYGLINYYRPADNLSKVEGLVERPNTQARGQQNATILATACRITPRLSNQRLRNRLRSPQVLRCRILGRWFSNVAQ